MKKETSDKIKEYLKSPAHQKVVRKAAVLSAKDQCDTLDTLVRDLTKAGSIPKSESKRRITKYCQDQDLQLSENIIVWLTNRNKELERKLEECSKKLKQRK